MQHEKSHMWVLWPWELHCLHWLHEILSGVGGQVGSHQGRWSGRTVVLAVHRRWGRCLQRLLGKLQLIDLCHSSAALPDQWPTA